MKRLIIAASLCCLTLPALAHEAASLHPRGAASAAGQAGDPAKAAREIAIGMWDAMRFTPGTLAIARGTTARLTVRNHGKLLHEIVLGSAAEIAQHREAMLRDPHMAHGAPNMAHVAPGAEARIVWQFSRAGTVEYACLLPGHYEAGMRGTIEVHGQQ